jgi:hypothetical protein
MEQLSSHWTEFGEFYMGGVTEIFHEILGLVKIWQK